MLGMYRAGAACALAVFGIVLAGVFAPAEAQSVAIAQVSGRVLDPTGAPIAGAQVRIIETGKQQLHETVSDGEADRPRHA